MKKITAIIFSVSMLIAGLCTAQPDGPPPPPGMEAKKEQVESMKIAFITQKLDLSPEEAQQFWPVYNKYRDELDKLRENHHKNMEKAGKDLSGLSDQEVEQFVDNEIAFRQTEVDILKKYHTQFKKVLPVKKVALFYRAEDEFKRELLRRMQKQKQGMGMQKH